MNEKDSKNQLLLNNPKVKIIRGWKVSKIHEGQHIGPSNGRIVISGKNGTQIRLDDSILSKNILCLGVIGAGKTESILMPIVNEVKKQMTDDDCMIVFDTKNDYVKTFYNANKDLIISNKKESKQNSYRYAKWNVFSEILFVSKEERLETTHEISRTLFDPYMGTKDNFFPMAAGDLTAAVLLSLAKKQGTLVSNKDIKEYLYDGDLSVLHQLLASSNIKGPLQYIDNPSSQTQGVLSQIKLMVKDLFSGSFSEVGDFSIRKFVQEKGGKTLFITYDAGMGRLLLPIYRLLFDLAIKQALSRERSTGNVYIVIDEMALLPKIFHIDDGVNFGRSLGLRFIAGAQNVGQITAAEAYGEGRGFSLLSGFGTLYAFRLQDNISRDFVASRYGINYKIISLPSIRHAEVVEHLIQGKVIEDWEISSLRTGNCIACLPDMEPFFFESEKYEA